MEQKQKAIFKAYAYKTNGALLKLGDKEDWYKPDDKVKSFIGKIKRGSEVIVIVDKNRNLSFIQMNRNSIFEKGKFEKNEQDNGIVECAKMKNETQRRISALNNATNLMVARGGDSLDKGKLLQVAEEFIQFLEKAE